MAGFTVKVDIQDAPVRALLEGLRQRTEDLTPAMSVIGEIVRSSVVKNFESEGRPTPWKKSRRAQKDGGRTLTRSARLMNSITSAPGPTSVEVSTNVVYARIHQLGGEIERPAADRVVHFKAVTRGKMTFGRPGNDENGKPLTDRFSKRSKASYAMKVAGKAYTIVMPKREFLMVQPEDWEEIRQELETYLSAPS